MKPEDILGAINVIYRIKKGCDLKISKNLYERLSNLDLIKKIPYLGKRKCRWYRWPPE